MSLPDGIEREPWRFDVLAALRRLEREAPDRPRIGCSASRREDVVTLGQDPYLDFPASALARAERDGQGRARLIVKFLGLLGPQGALPLATTEEAYTWWLARDDAFPRFLDILNNRFLQLFFRAWADARPAAQADRPAEDRFAAYVGAAIGLGSVPYQGLDAVPDRAKLAFAGLIGPQAKSASRLRGLLAGLFGVAVEVEQFVGSRLVFEEGERTRLGRRHAALGVDALLGGTVFSVQDKFRVRLVTRDLAEYRRFLPTGECCRALHDAVFFFIGEALDWDVELALPAPAAEPLRLGRGGLLGYTSWMAPRPGAEGLRRDARFHPAERFSARTRAA